MPKNWTQKQQVQHCHCIAENRLTTVSGATSISFVYDGDGNRVKSVLGGVVTTHYAGNHFEWTGNTTSMIKYYYAGSQRSLS